MHQKLLKLGEKIMKLTKLMTALALPVALIAGGNAYAATKITTWNYENEFAFTAFTGTGPGGTGVTATTTNLQPTFTLGSAPINPQFGDATTLAWGVPRTASGQSRLRLSDVSGKTTGVAVTDDGFVPLESIIHDNFVITGASLSTTTLTASLLLSSATPIVGTEFPISPISSTSNIRFKETNNAGVGGVCADGAARPCPDIFVLDPTGSSPLTNVFLGTIDGFKYFLDVDLTGLQAVGPESCAAAGLAPPCLGFITQENQSSTLRVDFRIRTAAIPEPGILALLGLGLSGIGFGQLRRRK
jgi:PEP-CTERM motif